MTRNKKNFLKISTIALLVIVFAVVGVGWYFLSRWESIALKELEDHTERLTNGLYRLKVNKIRLNIFNGYLSVDGISIHPDSARMAYLDSVDSIPARYAFIDIKAIELKGVNFKKKTKERGRSLNFSRITVNSPQFRIADQVSEGIRHEQKKRPSRTLYEVISPVFEQIRADEIHFDNGLIEYRLLEEADTAVYVMENISFHAEDFVVDSTSYARSRVLYCEDFHFYIENTHHLLPGKTYAINIGKVGLGIKDSTLTVEKIALVPQYPKQEFAYKNETHSDWMELEIGRLACSGMHFRDIILDKRIKIDSIRVQDVHFQTFKNQKIVVEHHKMPLLYEQTQRLAFPLDIGNIRVENLNVVYEELAKNGHVPGVIRFTKIDGEFQGFTNIVSSRNQTNKLRVKGRLMNEGKMDATFYFPVDSLNDRFEIIGTLGPMAMPSLNAIIEPLAPARIKQGFIQSMDYHIVGGRHQAKIDMKLLYNDLAIEILKEADGSHKSNQKLFSMLANGFVKNDNPDKGKEPRRVQTEWVRDPYHSSFNYLWKIYLSGLVETVGFTKEKKSRISWVKDEIDKLRGKDKKKK